MFDHFARIHPQLTTSKATVRTLQNGSTSFALSGKRVLSHKHRTSKNSRNGVAKSSNSSQGLWVDQSIGGQATCSCLQAEPSSACFGIRRPPRLQLGDTLAPEHIPDTAPARSLENLHVLTKDSLTCMVKKDWGMVQRKVFGKAAGRIADCIR